MKKEKEEEKNLFTTRRACLYIIIIRQIEFLMRPKRVTKVLNFIFFFLSFYIVVFSFHK